MKKILLCFVLIFIITGCGTSALTCGGVINENEDVVVEEEIVFVIRRNEIIEIRNAITFTFNNNVEENASNQERYLREANEHYDESEGIIVSYFRRDNSVGIDIKLVLDKLTTEEREDFIRIAGLHRKTHSDAVRAMNEIGHLCK